jgi:hypothetical protein
MQGDIFVATILATDTDEWRRATCPLTYETKRKPSTAHHAVIVRITSASAFGPLARAGYDGSTGTYTFHHALRARLIYPETELAFVDEYRLLDRAGMPHYDAPIDVTAIVIITRAAPPGGTPPPGPRGAPSNGGR